MCDGKPTLEEVEQQFSQHDNLYDDYVKKEFELRCRFDLSAEVPTLTHVFVEGDGFDIDILPALTQAERDELWRTVYGPAW